MAPGGKAETRGRDRRAPRTYFDDASVTGGRARNGGPPSSREAGLRSPEKFSAPRCPRGRLPPPPRCPSLSPPHYGHAGHSCFSRAPGCPCPLPSHSLRPLTARGCPRGSVRAASPAAASCVARAGVFSCSVHQRVPMPQEGDWRSRDTPHVFTDGTNSYSEQSRTRE